MDQKERDQAIQSLEKLRTDQSIKPNAASNPSFGEDDSEQRKRWFKRLSITAVFILIFSVSITVYANYDQFMGSKEKKTVEQQSQTTPIQKPSKTIHPETEAGEAFHLKFETKVVENQPKRKLPTKRQVPPTRLSTPPQPKKQDKPALKDTPIQLSEDYKQRIQHRSFQSDEVKKKK